MKITKVSNNFIDHVEKFECGGDVTKFLKPYLCPAKVPTIGFGNTFYENGAKVKLTDPVITKERAIAIFRSSLKYFEQSVDSCMVDTVNQNQFDAIVDFAYNAGIGALKASTLLKKINANPNDPTIAKEFMKWVYGGDGTKNKIDDDGDGLIDEPGEKKKFNGLVNRRKAEADLYFKK
jgi:lysozyme